MRSTCLRARADRRVPMVSVKGSEDMVAGLGGCLKASAFFLRTGRGLYLVRTPDKVTLGLEFGTFRKLG